MELHTSKAATGSQNIKLGQNDLMWFCDNKTASMGERIEGCFWEWQ